MIAYIVLGLLFVLLIVFCVLSAKHWHWINIVLVIGIFLSGTAAAAGLSQVFAKRTAAMKAAASAEENAERQEQSAREVVFGPDETIAYSPDSLRGIDEALKLQLIGTGRSWRNGTVEPKGANVTFKFSTPRAQADASAVSLQSVVLHAFVDAQLEATMYPAQYIGSVRVVSETEAELELEPVFLVSEEAFRLGGSWTLFERMPSDRYDTLRKGDEKDFNVTEFRRKLETEVFPAESLGLTPDSELYELLIDRIAFDGMTMGEIEKWIEDNPTGRRRLRFEPRASEIFVRYKFNAPSKNSYPVDSSGNLDVEGPFTLRGLAVDPSRHLGSEVKFDRTDELLVALPVAEGYQLSDGAIVPRFDSTEDVTEVSRIYRRHLHEFPFLFSELRRQAAEFEQRTASVMANNVTTSLASEKANDQIRARDEMIAKLGQDNKNLENDVGVISQLLESRSGQLESLRARVDALIRNIEQQKSQSVGASGY